MALFFAAGGYKISRKRGTGHGIVKNIQGITARNTVFQREKLMDRVFSIELLTQPLQLYESKGNKMLRIKRKGVEYGIYTNKARQVLTNKCIDTEHMKEWVRTINKQIHNFILGKNATETIEVSLGPVK